MRSIAFLSIFIIALYACTDSNKANENPETVKLKQQKFKTDSLISDSSLLIYAKIKGKPDLIQVDKKGRYPQNIETTYNVLKNQQGKVVYVAEMPYNAESDWFISYKSYFDEEGNLFVFQRLNNFLHNECTKGAALENLTKYFSQDFQVIDSAYTLTDSNKKKLDKVNCKFPYNFPYTISKTLEEYKKEHRIESF